VRAVTLRRSALSLAKSCSIGFRIKAVIPSKRNRKAPIPHDRAAYRQRHLVENLFCRIKDFTRIVLRKCKTTRSYAGFVSLAFTLVNLQLCP
jgi:transposase